MSILTREKKDRDSPLMALSEEVENVYDRALARISKPRPHSPRGFYSRAANKWKMPGTADSKRDAVDFNGLEGDDIIFTFIVDTKDFKEYPYNLIGRPDHVVKIQTTGPICSFSIMDYEQKVLRKLVYYFGHKGFELQTIDGLQYVRTHADGKIEVKLPENEIEELLKSKQGFRARIAQVMHLMFQATPADARRFLEVGPIEEDCRRILNDIECAKGLNP